MRFRPQPKTVAGSTALLVTVGLSAGLLAEAPAVQARPAAPASVVVDWTATALRTVYTEAASPVPSGALYVGFTSLAVYDAVRRVQGTPHALRSRQSAAAVAAHDVLAAYFPASKTNLDADLAASLASIRDGAAETRGIAIGHAAAARMVASRVDDGRPTPDEPSTLTFDKAPAVGVWRPTPPSNAPMLFPWLGFVEPLVLDSALQVRPSGPDPVTSAAYARDFQETKTLGALDSTVRTAAQTETAKFFNSNAVVQVLDGLGDMLTRQPMGLVRTARLYAVSTASMADALITTWRLKYDVGFWRPITGIREAATDGNPSTEADPAWRPLAEAAPMTGTPPYPENSSGHATIVNAFTESLALLGHCDDATDLNLHSTVTNTDRHYDSLSSLSQDAYNARIWLGLHFRAAMDDGRYVGEQTARIVAARVH